MEGTHTASIANGLSNSSHNSNLNVISAIRVTLSEAQHVLTLQERYTGSQKEFNLFLGLQQLSADVEV